MEATSCIKSVVVAANQYRNNKCDSNLVHLQRQLDVLVSVCSKGTSLKFFGPKQMLPTECLTCLVDILNDAQVNLPLAHKTMVLLNTLANDNDIRATLHGTFHLTSSLAAFLHLHATSPADQVTIQCVQLLQKVTYNTKISFQESFIDDLLRYIITNLQSQESELVQPCLGLMANLCRNNYSIQTHIKNMGYIKRIYKSVLKFLSHPSQTVVVFALSIVASLCFHEELGVKLFHAQNLHQTFQLMFNILVNGDSGTTRRCSVDLLLDLMRKSTVQQSFLSYDHLQPCLNQVLSLLTTKNAEAVSKIYELLVAFCDVPGLRSSLCKTLMSSRELQDDAQFQQNRDNRLTHEPFFASVYWAQQSVETHELAPLLALQFLREMYEEMIDSGLCAQLNSRSELVLPMVTEILMVPVQQEDETWMKARCKKLHVALYLLHTLCGDEHLKTQVAEAIDTKMCMQIVDFQLNNNPISINFNRATFDHNDCQWSEAGVDVVMYTLDLMLKVRRYVANMEMQCTKLIKDSRLVPFLAFGITSGQRTHVQIALRLLGIGLSLNEFPAVIIVGAYNIVKEISNQFSECHMVLQPVAHLGDSIAACNSRRDDHQRDLESSPPGGSSSGGGSISKPRPPSVSMYDKENIPYSGSSSSKNSKPSKPSKREDHDASVQNLIEKMQSGMDIKDVRASEIIDVYEHKLQSLQTKENHLQDLLEAKALALAQSDRLISQYRCRRAQSEAEAHKLRSLLQDSERKGEEYREQLNEMRLDQEKLTEELDHLSHECQNLQTVAHEHKELTTLYSEQTQRLESVQRSLSTLKQEYKTLSEMQEMMRRHNETLKQQCDVNCQQLAELEEERKTLSRQIKEKDTKVQELGKSLKKTESELDKVDKEREELEEAIDRLREELAKTEQVKKELQHQVSSLEVVCKQHETAIKEKDTAMFNMKSQLDKHAQITALIQTLSSGTVPPELHN